MKKKGILLFVFLFALVLKIGFVVTEAANPVSLLITESEESYCVELYLTEDVDMQSFQFRLHYDGTKVKLIDEKTDQFDALFRQNYNQNKQGLLTINQLENGKDSSLLFLGIQTDEQCARVKRDSLIATCQFEMINADADVVKRALALQAMTLTVEVLEGSNGNVVTDETEWTVTPVFGAGLEHLNKPKFDEERFTEIEGSHVSVQEDEQSQLEKENEQHNQEQQDVDIDSQEVENRNDVEENVSQREEDKEQKKSEPVETDSPKELEVGFDEDSSEGTEEVHEEKALKEQKEIQKEPAKKNERIVWYVVGSLVILILAGVEIVYWGKRSKFRKIDENTDKK